MTNVKKCKFPPIYTMKANKMSRDVCPLIHKFVPDRVELSASSHNCFTPVERACAAHLLADREGSEPSRVFQIRDLFLSLQKIEPKSFAPYLRLGLMNLWLMCPKWHARRFLWHTEFSAVPFF